MILNRIFSFIFFHKNWEGDTGYGLLIVNLIEVVTVFSAELLNHFLIYFTTCLYIVLYPKQLKNLILLSIPLFKMVSD